MESRATQEQKDLFDPARLPVGLEFAKITTEEALELHRLLRGRRFLKARQIPMPSRKIRAICAAYPDHFISTQAGYCLFTEATDREIENAIADLRSRGNKITKRASGIEQALYRRRQERLLS